MGVYHGFEKNEIASVFFLKKPLAVFILHNFDVQTILEVPPEISQKFVDKYLLKY